jgi:anthranilate synthase/aminodeoxychorismate synthase-like glutamine amidotransferase
MILLIDNYDSFTYNLYQYLGELGAAVTVTRNDAITASAITATPPAGLIISPGPGTPDQAGVSLAAIAALAGRRPVLGVCLGHQCIGQLFGGRIVRAPELVHGKTSAIYHDGRGLFAGLPNPFQATRYHSLVIDRATCPADLEICAWTADGLIMGVRHRHLPIAGVQFHPESIATERGKQLLANFLATVEDSEGSEMRDRGHIPATQHAMRNGER